MKVQRKEHYVHWYSERVLFFFLVHSFWLSLSLFCFSFQPKKKKKKLKGLSKKKQSKAD